MLIGVDSNRLFEKLEDDKCIGLFGESDGVWSVFLWDEDFVMGDVETFVSQLIQVKGVEFVEIGGFLYVVVAFGEDFVADVALNVALSLDLHQGADDVADCIQY